MFRTFIIGVVLGLIGAAAAAHFVPLYDLQREASIISVQANGGNAELFQIHLPADRIMARHDELQAPVPATLMWPDAELLAGTEVALFKVRNSNDQVIGVASRMTVSSEQSPNSVEWVLHLPARGSMYVPMDAAAESGGVRQGTLRAGTREFANRRGGFSEHYVKEIRDDDETPEGRIELRATLVASESAENGGASL